MPLDREKLGKLLALSASDNEHEALGCLRAANRMLKAENMTWADVLAGPEKSFRVTIAREPFTAEENWVAPHLKDKVMIDLMFRSVYSQPRTGNEDFWRWLDDIHNKFETYGHLTQAQYRGLRNSYQRVMRAEAKP